jgi:DNA invertase Pin-like site-specific DNA recombinase
MTREINIGYARVSTAERQILGLELQIRALKEAGCSEIFKEEVSGSRDDREQMLLAIELAKELTKNGEKVKFYIYKLDRLGRHTSKAIQIIEDLNESGIEVVSIKEQFDTSTPVGILQYQMLATFAEFELNNIRQRTKEGLEQAKLNGKQLGRPQIKSKTKKKVIHLYTKTELTVRKISNSCNVGYSTVYKILNEANIARRRRM